MDVSAEATAAAGVGRRFVGQRLLAREICFDTEKTTKDQKTGCAVRADDKRCVCCMLLSKRRGGKRCCAAKDGRRGRRSGQQNAFCKQKLKGFSFVRI